MYGIFTIIWLIFMVNLGKYTIHGWYGEDHLNPNHTRHQYQDFNIIKTSNININIRTSKKGFFQYKRFVGRDLRYEK